MKKKLKILCGIFVIVLIIGTITVAAFATTTEEQSAELSIESFSLSLENAVYMNFNVKSQNVSTPANIKILAWDAPPAAYEKGTEDVCLSSTGTDEITGYEVFQYDELAAKDMTKMIYICAYINQNGIETYSSPAKFSVAMYAHMKRNAAEVDANLVTLLDHMLQYGAQAQLYFKHNTDFLATDPIHKIAVENGTLEDGFQLGWYREEHSVTIIANPADEGYVFSHWENSAGENIGESETLEVSITDEETYTAVYVEVPVGSTGLTYTYNEELGGYEVSMGSCTDTEVLIPVSYSGKPIVKIAEYGFKDQAITSVTIPDSVTSIGDFAFQGCAKLTSPDLPNGISSFGWGVFYGCQSIVNIELPDTLTSIGRSSFEDCTNLVSIEIPEGVESIGHYMFSGCKSLAYVKIPDSVTSIGNYAFRYCEKLSSIDLPDSVMEMGIQVFNGCTALTTISIPNRYTHIGESVFYGATLVSVEIPNSVVKISYGAFNNCTNLKTVYYMGTATEWDEIYKESNNTALYSATRYYYSELPPTDTTYAYWHYDENEIPTPW